MTAGESTHLIRRCTLNAIVYILLTGRKCTGFLVEKERVIVCVRHPGGYIGLHWCTLGVGVGGGGSDSSSFLGSFKVAAPQEALLPSLSRYGENINPPNYRYTDLHFINIEIYAKCVSKVLMI